LFGDEGSAFASEVSSLNRDVSLTDPRVEIQTAASVIAAELQLEEGSSVVSRHQQCHIDGRPWSLQTSFFSMHLVERGATHLLRASHIDNGISSYLDEVLGIKETGVREKIRVRAPDEYEEAFFGLPYDGRVAVIEVWRSGYEPTGQPLRLTITVYPADRNEFIADRGEVPHKYAEADQHAEDNGDIQRSG
jgi:GntR family transcriptional regulator